MIIWNLCVIWYPYLEVMCHIIWLSGTYVSSDILIWKLSWPFTLFTWYRHFKYKVGELCKAWCITSRWTYDMTYNFQIRIEYHMIIWNLCVIWYPYLEVMCHIIWLSGTYVSSDILIWKLCIIFYSYLEVICHIIIWYDT
jgi:hypothetical protein